MNEPFVSVFQADAKDWTRFREIYGAERFTNEEFMIDGNEIGFKAVLPDCRTIAGFASWIPHSRILHHLYVAKEYQGAGIGTELLNELFFEFGDKNFRLLVHSMNKKAQVFYRSRGFRFRGGTVSLPDGKYKWMHA